MVQEYEKRGTFLSKGSALFYANVTKLLKDKVRKRIFELKDEKYKEFHTKLLASNSKMVGVRIPDLRKLAKEIAKGDWREYLKTAKAEYYGYRVRKNCQRKT